MYIKKCILYPIRRLVGVDSGRSDIQGRLSLEREKI